MSANVETMMYAGETPWHGLGTKVETEVTAAEAIVKAGLNWTVSTRPLLSDGGIQVRDHKAVVRSTDGAVLGVVGNYYSPIQNETAFALMDGVVGEGKAVYHTAGSLDGGRKVWILVKLPGDLVVGRNDRTEKFVLCSTSHDGSGSLIIMPTPVRVVCQNTLNLALGGDQMRVSIRHFSNADERIKAAAQAMQSATKWYDAFGTVAARLALFRYKGKLLRQLAEELFPSPETEEGDKLHPFTQRNRDRVIDLYETGQGHKAIAGTAFAALNAVAEFADHERSPKASQDKRVESLWFGRAADLKQRAHQIIERQIAAAA